MQTPNGLLAAGGDLLPERLLNAYRQGIFPWFSADDPILWWSPDPRMVLFPAEFKISRSLRKILRRGEYELRTDSAFELVMRACASPREGQDGTWIQEEVIEAYVRLLHPAYQDGEPVTWRRIADANGCTIHSEMPFGNIAGSWQSSRNPERWTQPPRPGTLPAARPLS